MLFMYLTSAGIKLSIACDLLTKQNPCVGQIQEKEVESHPVLVHYTTLFFMWIGYTESINLNYLFR